ncbi:carbohydrate ABC transporter permease [Marinicrinis lubricantis]|uniref:Carbohydrate ABC transporter permease n=1 Tax=Marinicrinis lubricantis TaxID=2086470 RepID=A0ABW1IQX8_9BACL
MSTKTYNARLLLLELVGVLLAILFLFPFYFLIVNSFKEFKDIVANTASFPDTFRWSNYSDAWTIMNYPRAFMNSLVITVISIIGIVLFSSMSSYWMVRHPTKLNQLLFGLFVAAMVIPFQAVMIPLVKLGGMISWGDLTMMSSRWGIIVCYFGFGIPLSVFLYHGYIKSVPLEIEEAAVVDGCSVFGVFWKIVFPLLKPMTVTVILLNSLWIWNDFLLPLLWINTPDLRTIPLSTYSFFGQYMKKWDLALPALIMGAAPIIIFFLALQKHIIEGITAGSVKG